MYDSLVPQYFAIDLFEKRGFVRKYSRRKTISSTVFSYKTSFFKQIYGTPMGSCISHIIASVYTEHIEHTNITTFHTLPSLWLRYVDDTFCILNKDHINDFRTHLNSICSYIQFTIEKEQNFSLPFLDVLVKRNSHHGSITTHSLLSTQFTENPRTLTDNFITRHITPNTRSSLLPKLYSAGSTLTSQMTHRNTVNYRTYAVPCD